MNLSTLAVLFLQTGFVLLIALIAVAATEKFPATRLAICRVGLLTLIGLLLWSPWAVERPRPVVPVDLSLGFTASEATSPSAPLIVRGGTGFPHLSANTPAIMAPPQASPAQPSLPLTAESAVLLAWGFGSLCLLGNLLVGLFRLQRLRAGSEPLWDPRVLALLPGLAKQTGVRVPKVFESPEGAGLFVSGGLTATLFVPKELPGSISEDDLAAVLRHEFAHLSNGDLVWNLVRLIVTTLLWWQPLVWLLRSPMESASEELCDRHVLQAGFSNESYARCLMALKAKAHGRSCPALSIGAVSSRSNFAARIESILDPTRSRVTRLSRITVTGIVAAAAITALGAPNLFARPEPVLVQPKGWGSRQPQTGLVPSSALLHDGKGATTQFPLDSRPFFGPVTLPNGAKVRLQYLQEETGRPHKLWAPDGSPVSSQDAESSLEMPNHFWDDSPSNRTIFAYVEVTGDSRKDPFHRCAVKPADLPLLSGVYQNPDDKNNRMMDLAKFRVPVDQKQTSLKFGVVAGPENVVDVGKIGEAPLHARVADTRNPPDREVVGKDLTAITFPLPSEFEDQDVRMVAFDRAGKPVRIVTDLIVQPRDSTGRQRRTVFAFPSPPTRDIAKVGLAVRNFQWVTFTGIHLYPNKR